MTLDANIELVRAGLEDFGAGDLDACAARLAPDLVINLCSDIATLMRQIG